jgi:hypothetical protein
MDLAYSSLRKRSVNRPVPAFARSLRLAGRRAIA